MDYLKTFAIILFISIISFLAAESDQLKQIYSDILVRYSKIKSYKASFIQENYWIELKTIKKTQGEIFYDEDHLLLDYSKPNKQFLLIDHKSVTMYDGNTDQAMISNNIEADIRPVKFISRYWDNSEKELIEADNKNYKIKLSTQENEQIHLSIKDSLLYDILILDENMNSVHYKFSNAKVNLKLPANIFDLTLPSNTNIIDTRQKK